MHTFSCMNFWLAVGKPRRKLRIPESAVGASTALGIPKAEDYESDDSLFELDISLSKFSLKENKTTEEREEKQRHETTTAVSVSTSKTQPPITVPKSDQKLRPFSFRKSKSGQSEKSTTEKKENNNRSQGARFRIDDEIKTESFSKTASFSRLQKTDDTMFDDSASQISTSSFSSSSSSERFFGFRKPLYTKTANKQISNCISTPSQSVRRQLGKSRSVAVGERSPENKVDRSLQVQEDGIQSAILHCKKSFYGLSESTGESSSQEILSTSSSEGK